MGEKESGGGGGCGGGGDGVAWRRTHTTDGREVAQTECSVA